MSLAEYFLEDTIEMLQFVPPPRALEKKKKKSLDDNEVHIFIVACACMFIFYASIGKPKHGL